MKPIFPTLQINFDEMINKKVLENNKQLHKQEALVHVWYTVVAGSRK